MCRWRRSRPLAGRDGDHGQLRLAGLFDHVEDQHEAGEHAFGGVVGVVDPVPAALILDRGEDALGREELMLDGEQTLQRRRWRGRGLPRSDGPDKARVEAPRDKVRSRASRDQRPVFSGWRSRSGESISMITEASAAGKPVLMFDFGGGPVAMRPSRWWRRWFDPYLETWIYALYMCLPRCRLNRTRDLWVVHCAVLASGRARWLGDETAGFPAAPSQFSDVARAVARVRALFGDPPP